MAEEPTSPLTQGKKTKTKTRTKTKTKTPSTAITARQYWRLSRLGNVFTGVWTLAAAVVTAGNLGLAQLMESQAQTVFFELRGQVDPPENIVILAIDEQSLSIPQQSYQLDPKQYADLEPLQAWPWKRTAYAIAIEKLMAAGARSVAMDVVFDKTSNDKEADERLRQALQRYAGRVTLAALYEKVETNQGSSDQLTEPNPLFWTEPVSIGTVNFPIEPNNKVYRFASEYQKQLAKQNQDDPLNALKLGTPSFDEAALQAANIKYPKPKGDHIYFYGPANTFKQIPFWHILDPEFWNSNLQGGKVFKDKIVLIGGTAQLLQDFHGTPLSESWLNPQPMSGVEIHANAIASLMEGRALAEAIPFAPLRGLFVLLLVGGTAVVVSKTKRGLNQFIWALTIAGGWGGICYLSFVYSQLILPAGVPIVAITLGGLSYLVTGAARENVRIRHLLGIFTKYLSVPIVQEIISQQDDLQDLLQMRELAISGKILGGRYRIVKVLGSGGFSETYVAEDIQRPNNPLCVVKQLRPANNKPKQLEVARRLFKLEAETLEKLGIHPQIPQLLAYFEQDEEFYLIQELIVGHPLSQELIPGKTIIEPAVIQILQNLLQTLAFVHSHGVIHRDIKPSNIIRRHSDGKLVLIDFGAVKEVTTQMLESEGQTGYTIGIGTQGYAPNEQCAGRPQFSSDIYAVGMIGIKALTGLAPHELVDLDANGELRWTHKAKVSSSLANVISKMVLYDYKQRYQTASEALAALQQLVSNEGKNSLPVDNYSLENTLPLEDLDAPTAPWAGVSEDIPSSSSSTTSMWPPQ